jgi:hypothetical protein
MPCQCGTDAKTDSSGCQCGTSASANCECGNCASTAERELSLETLDERLRTLEASR